MNNDHPHPPLNYAPSLHTTTSRQTSTTLPPEVDQCLRNARFLHLATISSSPTPSADTLPQPHVSLMNYTYLPSYRTLGPVILMTTNNQSLKTQNLRSNPHVSLLVHDWSSHRPPTAVNDGAGGQRSTSPTGLSAGGARSSLASLLFNLNTQAISSISTTITGTAQILDRGGEEEKWCKDAHLQNNTFEPYGQLSTEAGYFGGAQVQAQQQAQAHGTSGYIEGDDVRVVIVPLREGRISDFKGGVRDWVVVSDEDSLREDEQRGRQEPMVNGIVN